MRRAEHVRGAHQRPHVPGIGHGVQTQADLRRALPGTSRGSDAASTTTAMRAWCPRDEAHASTSGATGDDLAADGGQRPLELRYAALGIDEGAHGHDAGGERRLDEVLALHREPSALGARRRIAQRAQLTQRRMAPAA